MEMNDRLDVQMIKWKARPLAVTWSRGVIGALSKTDNTLSLVSFTVCWWSGLLILGDNALHPIVTGEYVLVHHLNGLFYHI